MGREDVAIDTSMEGETSIWVKLGWVASAILGILGCLLGASIGFFFGQGANTLLGGIIGLVVSFCLGVLCLGPAKDVYNQAVVKLAPPDATRLWLSHNTTWDLYVTVHHAQNVVGTEGIAGFFGKKNDSFMQVSCGRVDPDGTFRLTKNPPKRTCVRNDCVFTEVFKFSVAPTDDTLQISLYDQDMISEELVGSGLINISEQIMLEGFPQKRGYRLIRDAGIFSGKEERRAGLAVLSFQPGSNLPRGAEKIILQKSPLAFQQMVASREKLLKTMGDKGNASTYGTWVTTTV